jgi:hypothetical protein
MDWTEGAPGAAAVAFSNPLGTWQDILLLCANVFIDETKGEYMFDCM